MCSSEVHAQTIPHRQPEIRHENIRVDIWNRSSKNICLRIGFGKICHLGVQTSSILESGQ